MENGKRYIFDKLRKKWLLLTEEEWVRQNFVQFLIQKAGYPSTLIAMEKSIQLGELTKRFDILLYDRDHKPWMMIECKAAMINLDDAVLQQVLRYNISIPVSYIVITNGNLTCVWQKAGNRLEELESLPAWPPEKDQF